MFHGAKYCSVEFLLMGTWAAHQSNPRGIPWLRADNSCYYLAIVVLVVFDRFSSPMVVPMLCAYAYDLVQSGLCVWTRTNWPAYRTACATYTSLNISTYSPMILLSFRRASSQWKVSPAWMWKGSVIEPRLVTFFCMKHQLFPSVHCIYVSSLSFIPSKSYILLRFKNAARC